ncbi:hypothetical protein TNIN_260391 [Trichonephila inaurata madagascariensis]|uniref:Uncharacterized protein n=1 Tax=Trichonephila inaurata madagascariensis TaxID=2747483 RepID=A0A8X6J3Q8_9ARAC|nr:hypothetical protein TNIN_260391 [Trichonephila inaurata madagascariensis]
MANFDVIMTLKKASPLVLQRVLNPLQTFSSRFKNFPPVRRRGKKKSSSVLAYQRKSPNLPPLKLYVRKLGLANSLSKEQIRHED